MFMKILNFIQQGIYNWNIVEKKTADLPNQPTCSTSQLMKLNVEGMKHGQSRMKPGYS